MLQWRPIIGGVSGQRNSLDWGSNRSPLGLQLKEVIWVTKHREMVSPLDLAHFAEPETDFVLILPSLWSLAVITVGRMGTAPGSKLSMWGEEGPLCKYLASGAFLCLLFSLLLLTGGFDNPVYFFLGFMDLWTYESLFLLLPSSWESWEGSRSVVYLRGNTHIAHMDL